MDSILFKETFFGLSVQLSGFSICVLATALIGVTYYVYKAWVGDQPIQRVAWLIILGLDIVAFISDALFRGVFSPLIAVFVTSAFLTVLISFKRGEWNWTKTSTVCSVLGIAAMISMFSLPLWGLWISMIGLFIGCYPIYEGLFKKVHSEALWTWILIFSGSVFTWFDGQHEVAVGFGLIQGLVIALELRRRFTMITQEA